MRLACIIDMVGRCIEVLINLQVESKSDFTGVGW
jgi:hypothetical protein